jgi:adenylate cyclase
MIFVSLFALVTLFLAKKLTTDNVNIQVISDFGIWQFSLILAALVSFVMAILSSVVDLIVIRSLFKRKPLWFLLIVGFIAQSLMIIFVMGMADHLLLFLLKGLGNGKVDELSVVSQESRIIILAIIILIGKIFIEIDQKLGPGNLLRMLSGRFYTPREVERIFMFIDLKDSTPLAVQLGNLKFSRLLQDCFHDFSVVAEYGANIYQYVGDEVVVSWKIKKGYKQINFLNAFFAFVDKLESRKAYYLKNYGVQPYFKAGVNVGPVVVTEVGQIKQEISYHGDALNTAARIQGKCNEFDAQILIPETIYKQVKNVVGFRFKNVGDVALKGKEQMVHLYSVEKTD